jgi:hypothetical protein
MRRWTLRLEQRVLLYNDNLAQSELGDPLANSLTDAANRLTRSRKQLWRGTRKVMRRVLNTGAIAIILLIPRMALAQATIAGVVRDASSE